MAVQLIVRIAPWTPANIRRSRRLTRLWLALGALVAVLLLLIGFGCTAGGGPPAELWHSFMAQALPHLKVQAIPAGPTAPDGAYSDPIGDLLSGNTVQGPNGEPQSPSDAPAPPQGPQGQRGALAPSDGAREPVHAPAL